MTPAGTLVEEATRSKDSRELRKSPALVSQDIDIQNTEKPLDVPHDFEIEDVLEIIRHKADKSDIKYLKENKTNKLDSEHQMQAIDIMHRQINHTVVLLLEIVK